MLVFKASQIVAIAPPVLGKPWEMTGDDGKPRSGISNYAEVTALSANGGVGVIRLKGRDEADVKRKTAPLTVGKPAEIVITRMRDSKAGVVILEG